jgi:hypothetical protein
VTVTCVDQCAGPVGGGARFLLQAMTPQTAVMTEMRSRTAQRLTISATSDTPPASCTFLSTFYRERILIFFIHIYGWIRT